MVGLNPFGLRATRNFTEKVVSRIAEGISTGGGQIAVERFEVADSLLWPSLRIRFRVLADAPKLQDPNKVISLIQQEKGYTVSSEWRPEPFFFFVFTNRLSIDRNVEALI